MAVNSCSILSIVAENDGAAINEYKQLAYEMLKINIPKFHDIIQIDMNDGKDNF